MTRHLTAAAVLGLSLSLPAFADDIAPQVDLVGASAVAPTAASPTAPTAVSPVVVSTAAVPGVSDAAKPVARFMHGFRIGYTYVNGITDESPLRSPHLFVIGYEATQRAIGGGWLNVITVENFSIAGINQSMFIPSLNGLLGFELREQLQVGTGININPFDPHGKYVHQVVAVGWTPRAGAFNVPVHLTFIPDLDGNWRLGTTVGVNW